MPVFNIFSKRKHIANSGDDIDAFIYDTLPQKFRVQTAHIFRRDFPDAISELGLYRDAVIFWDDIANILSRELGLIALSDERNPQVQCIKFLTDHQNVDEVLSLIELAFQRLKQFESDHRNIFDAEYEPAQRQVDELNTRFMENRLGYEFTDGSIVEKSSEWIHSEITKPALRVLSSPGFEGPKQEFIQAYEHLSNKNYRECITSANNTYESTLKVICDQRKIKYSRSADAKQLIQAIINAGILEGFLAGAQDPLAKLLSSALPVVRHNVGAHGQGSNPSPVDKHWASYALHMCAANVHFLSRVTEA